MVGTCFQMIFANDLRNQRIKVKSILEYLKNEIPFLAEDDLYDLRLIYSELLNNAIVHGNKYDITKKVELFVEIEANILKSAVRDEGLGFDYTKYYKTSTAHYNLLTEHGRGIKLVTELTDFIKWNDKGNEIMFHKILIDK